MTIILSFAPRILISINLQHFQKIPLNRQNSTISQIRQPLPPHIILSPLKSVVYGLCFPRSDLWQKGTGVKLYKIFISEFTPILAWYLNQITLCTPVVLSRGYRRIVPLFSETFDCKLKRFAVVRSIDDSYRLSIL